MHINKHRLSGPWFERKQTAAAATAWNSYNIHDRAAVHKRIDVMIVGYSQERAKLAKKGIPIPDIDSNAFHLNADIRYYRHRGDTSKYQPHQGARECARRAQ